MGKKYIPFFLLFFSSLEFSSAKNHESSRKKKNSLSFSLRFQGDDFLKKAQKKFHNSTLSYGKRFDRGRKHIEERSLFLLEFYQHAFRHSLNSGRKFEIYMYKMSKILIAQHKKIEKGQERRVFFKSSAYYKNLLHSYFFDVEAKKHSLSQRKNLALKLNTLSSRDQKFIVSLSYFFEDIVSPFCQRKTPYTQQHKEEKNIFSYLQGKGSSLLGSLKDDAIRSLLIDRGPWKLYDEGPTISLIPSFKKKIEEDEENKSEGEEKSDDENKSDNSEESDNSKESENSKESDHDDKSDDEDHKQECILVIDLPEGKTVLVDIYGCETTIKDSSKNNSGSLFVDDDPIKLGGSVIANNLRVGGGKIILTEDTSIDTLGKRVNVTDSSTSPGSIFCRTFNTVVGSCKVGSEGLSINNTEGKSCDITGNVFLKGVTKISSNSGTTIVLGNDISFDLGGRRCTGYSSIEGAVMSLNSILVEGKILAGPKGLEVDNNKKNTCKIYGSFLTSGPTTLSPGDDKPESTNINISNFNVVLSNCNIAGGNFGLMGDSIVKSNGFTLKCSDNICLDLNKKILMAKSDINADMGTSSLTLINGATVISRGTLSFPEDTTISSSKIITLSGDTKIKSNNKIIASELSLECPLISLCKDVSIKTNEKSMVISDPCVKVEFLDKCNLKSNDNPVVLLDHLSLDSKDYDVKLLTSCVLQANGFPLVLKESCPSITLGSGSTGVVCPSGSQINCQSNLNISSSSPENVLTIKDPLLLLLAENNIHLKDHGSLYLNGKNLTIFDSDGSGLVKSGDKSIALSGSFVVDKSGVSIDGKNYTCKVTGSNISAENNSVVVFKGKGTVKDSCVTMRESCVDGVVKLCPKTTGIETNGCVLNIFDEAKISLPSGKKSFLKTNGNTVVFEDICSVSGETTINPDSVICIKGEEGCKKRVVILTPSIEIDSFGQKVEISDSSSEGKGLFTVSGDNSVSIANCGTRGNFRVFGHIPKYLCPKNKKTEISTEDDSASFTISGCVYAEGGNIEDKSCIVVPSQKSLTIFSGFNGSKAPGKFFVPGGKICCLGTESCDNNGIVLATTPPGCKQDSKFNLQTGCVRLNLIS